MIVNFICRACCYDRSVRLSRQRVFKNSCQLRITIGYVLWIRCQRMHYIAQAWQRQIYLLSLLQCLTLDSTFPYFLRSRQINKTQLALMLKSFAFVSPKHKQNRMTSWWCIVIVSRCHFPVPMPQSYQIENFRLIFDLNLNQSLYENLVIDLFEFKIWGLSLVVLRKNKQIHHLLVVNL